MSPRRSTTRLRTWALGALALAAATLALAVDNTPPFSDPALQARYYGLTHEMRCMQCQNEALADSNVSLAADLDCYNPELDLLGKFENG